MAAWILSIVGIVILGVLLDTVMPDGKMQKYIRSIFALITVFVIISPLPGLINKEFDFNINTDTPASTVDDNFIMQYYKSKVTLLEKSVETELASEGWSGVSVTVYVDVYNENMKITSVLLNLQKVVIDKNKVHILNYEEISDKVSGLLKISKGIILRI